MKNKGVIFEIPNKYGKFLSEILESIPFKDYEWLIDNDEIHLLNDDGFTNEFLFQQEERVIKGERLYNTAKENIYYLIFVNLWAFQKGGIVKSVKTYKEFLQSDCQIALGVYDCSYVMFWCKDSKLVSQIYSYAMLRGYKNVEYISEDDLLNKEYYIE